MEYQFNGASVLVFKVPQISIHFLHKISQAKAQFSETSQIMCLTVLKNIGSINLKLISG